MGGCCKPEVSTVLFQSTRYSELIPSKIYPDLRAIIMLASNQCFTRWALTHEPEPLTPELAKEFTWEAATSRLIHSSAITRREAIERVMLGKVKLDERIAFFHRELGKGTKGDALRKILGGGPISHQVKYESSKQGLDQEGSENEGLTQKFKSSSFVRAIKSSFAAVGSPAYSTT